MVLSFASFGEHSLIRIFEVSGEQLDLWVHFGIDVHGIIRERLCICFSLFIQIFLN